MSTRKIILKTFFAGILGLWLQLLLHELGHAIFAYLTGNKVSAIKIGLISYAEIAVANNLGIPIISLGAFILPIIITLLLLNCSNRYYVLNMTTISIGIITVIQIIINVFAIWSKNTNNIDTYDLYIFIKNSGYNKYTVGIIAVIIACIILGKCFNKIKKVLKYKI